MRPVCWTASSDLSLFVLLLQVQRLGVCSILVPTSIGLCLKTFQEGLEKYAAQYG